MTRPIYEPSPSRKDAYLEFGNDQLFRRPAPSTTGYGTTAAYFNDYTFTGTGASVANNTWVEVVTGVGGANNRWFNEFNFDPAGDWGRNFATGSITNAAATSYLYSAWGYVVFDVVDGTWVGASISWVGVEVQTNTGETKNGRDRIVVIAERVPIPAGGIRLQCYQQSGGAADLLEARLHVRRFEPYGGVFEQQFAT